MEERSSTYTVYVVSHRPYPVKIEGDRFYWEVEEAKKVRDELNAKADGLRIYKVYPLEITTVKTEIH